jgi:hypothetical protein
MHASHLQHMRDILPNLDRVIFDAQPVTIGGGEFDAETIRSVMLAVRWCLAREVDPSLIHDINAALHQSMDDKLVTDSDGPWLPIGLCLRISQAVLYPCPPLSPQ